MLPDDVVLKHNVYEFGSISNTEVQRKGTSTRKYRVDELEGEQEGGGESGSIINHRDRLKWLKLPSVQRV